MWTKRQLIDQAFSELGIAGYTFDIEPEEVQDALRRLDSMLATWRGKGINIGYAFPSSATASDPDDASGIPDSANEAVYLNLAIREAPGRGKQVSTDTRRAARDAYDSLLWMAAQPISQQLPNTLPRGAGNKPWGTTSRPFFGTPDAERLVVPDAGALELLG